MQTEGLFTDSAPEEAFMMPYREGAPLQAMVRWVTPMFHMGFAKIQYPG